MGIYDIEIQSVGVSVKVRVVDQACLVGLGLSELKPLIGTATAVGLVVNYHPSYSKPPMLQLCVGTRCLVVQLDKLDSIPQCLKSFLADQEICFVGVGMSRGLLGLKSQYGIECTSGIELSELAARILKKPRLCGIGGIFQLPANTSEIAAEVGYSLEEPKSLGQIDLYAKVFSYDQIKYLIYDVYGSHLIGSKLLGSL